MELGTHVFCYCVIVETFIWGSATSAYQIEGAWNVDGKGENIWDVFTHEPGNIVGGDTGDVACDSYNLYEEDVRLLKDMGVDYYRFSLSWARIIPLGEGEINQLGIDYYNNLIDMLLENGIKPLVTMYHWDLPQALQDNYGGWENETLVLIYKEYARVAFESFGDRVKMWVTFNEPWVITTQGYEFGLYAPGINKPGYGAYRVGHVVLKAHAEAWHLYDDEFRAQQNGMISLVLNSDWKEPWDNSTEHTDAAYRALAWNMEWFAHPIYLTGDYPEVMKEQIASKSEEVGLDESRLPEFTPEESARILGTWDFFGLNHYTSLRVRNLENNASNSNFYLDQDVLTLRDPDWPTSGSIWLRVVPWGLRKLLNHIKDTYGNPPVLITENGISDNNGTLNDEHRINYFRDYINNVLKANVTDGCNVIGYTAWSLLDNFEWSFGFEDRFGIHYTNFSDPDLIRTPKDSSQYLTQLIADNGFPEPEDDRTAKQQRVQRDANDEADVFSTAQTLCASVTILLALIAYVSIF